MGLQVDLNGYGVFRRDRDLDPGSSNPQRITIPTTLSPPYGEGRIGISTNTRSEKRKHMSQVLNDKTGKKKRLWKNARVGVLLPV